MTEALLLRQGQAPHRWPDCEQATLHGAGHDRDAALGSCPQAEEPHEPLAQLLGLLPAQAGELRVRGGVLPAGAAPVGALGVAHDEQPEAPVARHRLRQASGCCGRAGGEGPPAAVRRHPPLPRCRIRGEGGPVARGGLGHASVSVLLHWRPRPPCLPQECRLVLVGGLALLRLACRAGPQLLCLARTLQQRLHGPRTAGLGGRGGVRAPPSLQRGDRGRGVRGGAAGTSAAGVLLQPPQRQQDVRPRRRLLLLRGGPVLLRGRRGVREAAEVPLQRALGPAGEAAHAAQHRPRRACGRAARGRT
mmetsp:Transcript_71259/g.230769  ORF Transcript_71259/g.230769 Transcript_71259/m.230769 type:complete len:305 (+) Transcript_71259:499-1413(+)